MAGGIGHATDILKIMTSSPDRREDDALLEAIRAGDASAFTELVDRYEVGMLKMARAYVGDPTAAEEVVQETWLAVVEGIRKFKHRSSIKTWVFGILVNQSRKYTARRAREIPEALKTAGASDDPTSGWFDEAGEWRSKPAVWSSTPESDLLAEETVQYIHDVIASLPQKQRIVLTLREIDGWTSKEVCDLMKISRTDQRVLLHHAKMKLQQMVGNHLATHRKPASAPETEGSKP
jgi:RNA polymerase sigma-70 factor, ECF subfamily